MANTLLTPTLVTREALRVLHQKLRFVGSINRQYDDSFAKKGAKSGETLKIRLPNQYTVRSGATLSTQDTTETSVTLQVATQKGVDLNFSSNELTLSLDDFSKRILRPAMAVLAASIESDALAMRKEVWNQVNDTAAALSFANVLNARKVLNDNLTPDDDRRTALLRTKDNVSLVDALKGLFQDSSAIKSQYKEGMMGRTGGFDFFETTHLATQSRGSGASYTTNTTTGSLPISSTPVTSITTAGGTGTVNQGEIFTIANVFSVHPETKVSTGILQQFVSTANQTGTGSWAISPSIILAGPYQNVTIPSTSATAALTIAGTASTDYGQSMVYHEDAFTFATADLVMPQGVDFSAREMHEGISMRIVRQYDINNDKFPCRLDVLYGYKTLRPQLACRLANLA
jgi:hypothetical protein